MYIPAMVGRAGLELGNADSRTMTGSPVPAMNRPSQGLAISTAFERELDVGLAMSETEYWNVRS